MYKRDNILAISIFLITELNYAIIITYVKV